MTTTTALTSQVLKEFALQRLKVDGIGVANIERFKDAPPEMNPLNIMPRCRSVVAFYQRILRGCYRGIDEGTHFPSYTVFCYAGLNALIARSNYRLARFVESFGWEGVPTASGAAIQEYGPRGEAPAPGKPRREVVLQHRIAATLAGLGEIGWSKVFMTEDLGPRQRIGLLLTDAELEPDPIRINRLCDKCKRCVSECPGQALPKDKSVSIEVEGHKMEWSDIDLGKCKLTHFGLNRANSPYLCKQFPGLNLPIGEQEVTWREAWDLGYAMFTQMHTGSVLSRRGHPPGTAIALCGARGCVVGCMKHMEARGRVGNVFNTKKVFSEKKPWRLPERPPHVDHHGMVFDPVTGASIREPEKEAGPSSWY